jgi:hypothetical protein
MGVDVLDPFPPPPESSPTVGGGIMFFGSIGVVAWLRREGLLKESEEGSIHTSCSYPVFA